MSDAAEARTDRVDAIQRLLAERGHDAGFAGLRVAAGRSGIAVGFPTDPMLHVSWWAILGLGLLTASARLFRRNRRSASSRR
jgi:hypothetical protein